MGINFKIKIRNFRGNLTDVSASTKNTGCDHCTGDSLLGREKGVHTSVLVLVNKSVQLPQKILIFTMKFNAY